MGAADRTAPFGFAPIERRGPQTLRVDEERGGIEPSHIVSGHRQRRDRRNLRWGFRPRDKGNPLENVAEPKAARRTRLLTAGEVGALLKALERAEADRTEEPQIIAAIRAVILTGARISELLTLQWDHIRPDETELHLPDTKTGFSRRPISTNGVSGTTT